jgi:hypothetical protein
MADFKSKFARPVATPPRRVSKYDGVEPAASRLPMLPPGTYRLVWEHATANRLGTGIKVTLEIAEIIAGGAGVANGVDAPAVQGSSVQYIQAHTSDAGLSQVVALVMAFAGYDDREAFHAAFPGDLIEACSEGHDDRLCGRTAFAVVTRGKDVTGENGTPTGDYYRNYRWQPAEPPA